MKGEYEWNLLDTCEGYYLLKGCFGFRHIESCDGQTALSLEQQREIGISHSGMLVPCVLMYNTTGGERVIASTDVSNTEGKQTIVVN